MWNARDISVVTADVAAEPATERVIERLRARRLPVERGSAARYLVVCCRTVDATLLKRLKVWSTTSAERTILVTESAPSSSDAWQALRHGATDIVTLADADGVADRLERWLQLDELLVSPLVTTTLIGESPGWLALLRELVDLARFSNINLMIGGESGTGKELAARLMHTLDARPKKGEFVIVDCTTIIPTLAGSELFGHERGAFTGAERAREGAFARANGGTLFLDEIAELALPLQAELLRVIQEGTYKPVGGNDWCKTEFRLVCATHRDLAAAVAAGTFRQDLYFRIASAEIRLPPLRERRDDIPKLAEHFLTELRPDCGGLDKHLIAFLQAREWPGNIRELRHYVQRIAARHCGTGLVTIGSLPREEIALVTPEQPPEVREQSAAKPGADLEAAVRSMLREGIALPEIARRAGDLAVDMVLEDERGNLPRAARRLGVTDRALQQRRQRRAGPADGAEEAASVPPRESGSPGSKTSQAPADPTAGRWPSKPSFESMKGESSPGHPAEAPAAIRLGEPRS